MVIQVLIALRNALPRTGLYVRAKVYVYKMGLTEQNVNASRVFAGATARLNASVELLVRAQSVVYARKMAPAPALAAGAA